MIRVLIIDGVAQQARATAQILRARMRSRVKISIVGGAAECEAYLDEHGMPDCVLLNMPLPDRLGLDLLSDIMLRDPLAAVVVTTSKGDDATAVEAMKRGAMDYYVRRNFSETGLERAVLHAVERSQMARRIEDQQHSLRTFAHVLVHDLRGPLRSIRGGIGMLLEDLPKDTREEHSEVLGFVQDGAERMDQLIVALHRYCSLDDATLNIERVDLDLVVRDLRATLRADLRDKGADLTCPAMLPAVLADPTQLTQLLQNLVANGIKYNQSTAPRVHISASEGREGWRIEVSDNGIGIEPEYLEEVFQPFRRLHAAAEYSGTGLGLATCRRIAERHGGQLTCRSKPGEGAVFVLDLPRQRVRRQVSGGAAFAGGKGVAAIASR
ncbi:sensor histidine kinase [Sagittula sp. S175]|uniref:sensor histidine kinase n=1 Tax=Sagittula sp. S175 TaxID=3415129 RepID=UPI003C7BCE98